MMVDELMHMTKPDDPIGLLATISLFREDMPWLYELGLEVYRAIQRGNVTQIRKAGRAFHIALDFTSRGPFARELHDKETFFFLKESMELLHRYIERAIDQSGKKAAKRRASSKT